MSLLNLRPEAPAKRSAKSRLFKILGVGGILGAVALGSTFAANISLNGDQNVEFGQGVAATTACDNSVILTPTASFVNSAGAGEFLFTTVSVTGISDDCFGKTFVIRAFKNGENSPLDLYLTGETDVYSQIEIYDNSGTYSLENAGLLSDDITTLSDGFSITFSTQGPPVSVPLASTQDVDRITIETLKSVYQVGDTGPGGGTVIYDAGSHQSWGRYIEVAPSNWNGSAGDAVNVVWCSDNFLDVNSDSTGIGTGKSNTDRMVGSNCSTGVGIKARSYSGGGKGDWSVPSIAEMQLIFIHTDLVQGLLNTGNAYWTSNGAPGDGRWVGNVVGNNGGIGGVNKAQTGPGLRPIRLF